MPCEEVPTLYIVFQLFCIICLMITLCVVLNEGIATINNNMLVFDDLLLMPFTLDMVCITFSINLTIIGININ